MQKKQVTVNVTHSVTLLLENEDLNENKVRAMVERTIEHMTCEFNVDTNSCLYDDGLIGSIEETELIQHEVMAVATCDNFYKLFSGIINAGVLGTYEYEGVMDETNELTVTSVRGGIEALHIFIKDKANEYFAWGAPPSAMVDYKRRLNAPDLSNVIDLTLAMNIRE